MITIINVLLTFAEAVLKLALSGFFIMISAFIVALIYHSIRTYNELDRTT